MISRTENIYSDSLTISVVEDGAQLKIDYSNNDRSYDPKVVDKISVDTSNIYKPIQYLGAKYRPLPIILSKTLEIIAPNTYVLDLFSGSSVVSQVFNLNNLDVISNDALQFNSVFSKTLLNIKRKSEDLRTIPLVIEKLKTFEIDRDFSNPFQELIIEEARLLSERDTKKILELYFGVPQIDKVLFLNGSNAHAQTKYILKHIGESAFEHCPLIANYYAGTYFSIHQALELDRLRNGIERLFLNQEISEWQYHFLLTCLLNVSSKIVYTAGKHFAQPIKHENIFKTEVLHKRFYEDRLKNVWDEFLKSSYSLSLISEENVFSQSNIVHSKKMEDIIRESSSLPPVSVIYADPPYTAQQYSRYYHIPEVIYNYRYPQLQVVDGKATTGLYPDNKFKSRFCSKREAYNAFTDLFSLAAELKSSLILSYSSSLSNETGNIRMISLDEIMEIGYRLLPMCSFEVLKFDFRYRQLNTSAKIVEAKDDREFLIIFKQP